MVQIKTAAAAQAVDAPTQRIMYRALTSLRFILRPLGLLLMAAALAAAVYAPSQPPLDRSPEPAAARPVASPTVAGPRLGAGHTGVLLVTGDFLAHRPSVPSLTTTVPRFPPERTATLLFAGDFLPTRPSSPPPAAQGPTTSHRCSMPWPRSSRPPTWPCATWKWRCRGRESP